MLYQCLLQRCKCQCVCCQILASRSTLIAIMLHRSVTADRHAVSTRMHVPQGRETKIMDINRYTRMYDCFTCAFTFRTTKLTEKIWPSCDARHLLMNVGLATRSLSVHTARPTWIRVDKDMKDMDMYKTLVQYVWKIQCAHTKIENIWPSCSPRVLAMKTLSCHKTPFSTYRNMDAGSRYELYTIKNLKKTKNMWGIGSTFRYLRIDRPFLLITYVPQERGYKYT